MDILIYISGVITGIILYAIVYSKLSVTGTLKIDHSNPEKDVYLFDIKDLDKLSKKRALLKIDHNANLTQNSQGIL